MNFLQLQGKRVIQDLKELMELAPNLEWSLVVKDPKTGESMSFSKWGMERTPMSKQVKCTVINKEE